jgi:ribonuclease-3
MNEKKQEQHQESCLPHNPQNVPLTTEKLSGVLMKYGVHEPFKDINLYRMAFVHKSYCTRKNENFQSGNIKCPDNCMYLQESNNERLEFLGDSVLGLAVADYLYERFPESEEGFLTKMRTKLVNGQMLARLALELDLGDWLIVSKQIEDNNGRSNIKLLEDTFEAFLGALFLDFGDCGFIVTKRFIINLLESYIDFSDLVLENSNYKGIFLKYYQQIHNDSPKFYELRVTTTKHGGKEYHMSIKNKNGHVISTGKGYNKKAAEADAAYNALKYFGQL